MLRMLKHVALNTEQVELFPAWDVGAEHPPVF